MDKEICLVEVTAHFFAAGDEILSWDCCETWTKNVEDPAIALEKTVSNMVGQEEKKLIAMTDVVGFDFKVVGEMPDHVHSCHLDMVLREIGAYDMFEPDFERLEKIARERRERFNPKKPPQGFVPGELTVFVGFAESRSLPEAVKFITVWRDDSHYVNNGEGSDFDTEFTLLGELELKTIGEQFNK